MTTYHIVVSEETKKRLDVLKTGGESYNDVISRLLPAKVNKIDNIIASRITFQKLFPDAEYVKEDDEWLYFKTTISIEMFDSLSSNAEGLGLIVSYDMDIDGSKFILLKK